MSFPAREGREAEVPLTAPLLTYADSLPAAGLIPQGEIDESRCASDADASVTALTSFAVGLLPMSSSVEVLQDFEP